MAKNLDDLKASIENAIGKWEKEHSRKFLSTQTKKELESARHSLKDLRDSVNTLARRMSSEVFFSFRKPKAIRELEGRIEDLDTRITEIGKAQADEKEEIENAKKFEEKIGKRKEEIEKLLKKREADFKGVVERNFNPQGFGNRLAANVDLGFTLPLLSKGEIEDLKRKKEALDLVYKRQLEEGGDLQGIIKSMIREGGNYASILATFLEETTVGLGQTVYWFFTGMIVFPIKAAHWTLRGIEAGTGALAGIPQTFRQQGQDLMALPVSGLKGVSYLGTFVLKGLGGVETFVAGAAEAALKGVKWVFSKARYYVDSDMWIRKAPGPALLSTGFIGGAAWITVSIVMVLAGIPTLGIAPAIWFGASGLAVAFSALGAFIKGRQAASAQKKLLEEARLPVNEELQVAKLVHDHDTKPKADRDLHHTATKAPVVSPDERDSTVHRKFSEAASAAATSVSKVPKESESVSGTPVKGITHQLHGKHEHENDKEKKDESLPRSFRPGPKSKTDSDD